MKEIGTDALNALNMICYEIDKKYGTPYSARVAKYRRYLEENDLSMAGAVTDVKGDRQLRPSQQEMPYYYLKVVERRRRRGSGKGMQGPHDVGAHHERAARPADEGHDGGG